MNCDDLRMLSKCLNKGNLVSDRKQKRIFSVENFTYI
jgi:hypothetical protein